MNDMGSDYRVGDALARAKVGGEILAGDASHTFYVHHPTSCRDAAIDNFTLLVIPDDPTRGKTSGFMRDFCRLVERNRSGKDETWIAQRRWEGYFEANCARSGVPQKSKGTGARERASKKTKCEAKVVFRKTESNDLRSLITESCGRHSVSLPSSWSVYKVSYFSFDHNHDSTPDVAPPATEINSDLLLDSSTRALENQCVVNATRQFVSIRPKFSKNGGARVEAFLRYLRSTVTNARVPHSVARNILAAFESKEGEAAELIEYLEQKKRLGEIEFLWVDVDGNGYLKTIIFTPLGARAVANRCSDVMFWDPTHNVTAFEYKAHTILLPSSECNSIPILYSFALESDTNLCATILAAQFEANGLNPDMYFSDGDEAISGAIALLPDSSDNAQPVEHGSCLFHLIDQNALSNVRSSIVGGASSWHDFRSSVALWRDAPKEDILTALYDKTLDLYLPLPSTASTAARKYLKKEIWSVRRKWATCFFPRIITLGSSTTAIAESWQKDSKGQAGGRMVTTTENICTVMSARMDTEVRLSQNLADLHALAGDPSARGAFLKYCVHACFSNACLRLLREELEEAGVMAAVIDSKQIIENGFILDGHISRQSAGHETLGGVDAIFTRCRIIVRYVKSVIGIISVVVSTDCFCGRDARTGLPCRHGFSLSKTDDATVFIAKASGNEIAPEWDTHIAEVMKLLAVETKLALLLGSVAKRWRQPSTWNLKSRVSSLKCIGVEIGTSSESLPMWLRANDKAFVFDTLRSHGITTPSASSTGMISRLQLEDENDAPAAESEGCLSLLPASFQISSANGGPGQDSETSRWVSKLLARPKRGRDGPTRHTFPHSTSSGGGREAHGRLMSAMRALAEVSTSSDSALAVGAICEAFIFSTIKEIRAALAGGSGDLVEDADQIVRSACARALSQPRSLLSPCRPLPGDGSALRSNLLTSIDPSLLAADSVLRGSWKERTERDIQRWNSHCEATGEKNELSLSLDSSFKHTFPECDDDVAGDDDDEDGNIAIYRAIGEKASTAFDIRQAAGEKKEVAILHSKSDSVARFSAAIKDLPRRGKLAKDGSLTGKKRKRPQDTRVSKAQRKKKSQSIPPGLRDTTAGKARGLVPEPVTTLDGKPKFGCPFCLSFPVQNNYPNVEQHIEWKHAKFLAENNGQYERKQLRVLSGKVAIEVQNPAEAKKEAKKNRSSLRSTENERAETKNHVVPSINDYVSVFVRCRWRRAMRVRKQRMSPYPARLLLFESNVFLKEVNKAEHIECDFKKEVFLDSQTKKELDLVWKGACGDMSDLSSSDTESDFKIPSDSDSAINIRSDSSEYDLGIRRDAEGSPAFVESLGPSLAAHLIEPMPELDRVLLSGEVTDTGMDESTKEDICFAVHPRSPIKNKHLLRLVRFEKFYGPMGWINDDLVHGFTPLLMKSRPELAKSVVVSSYDLQNVLNRYDDCVKVADSRFENGGCESNKNHIMWKEARDSELLGKRFKLRKGLRGRKATDLSLIILPCHLQESHWTVIVIEIEKQVLQRATGITTRTRPTGGSYVETKFIAKAYMHDPYFPSAQASVDVRTSFSLSVWLRQMFAMEGAVIDVSFDPYLGVSRASELSLPTQRSDDGMSCGYFMIYFIACHLDRACCSYRQSGSGIDVAQCHRSLPPPDANWSVLCPYDKPGGVSETNKDYESNTASLIVNVRFSIARDIRNHGLGQVIQP